MKLSVVVLLLAVAFTGCSLNNKQPNELDEFKTDATYMPNTGSDTAQTVKYEKLNEMDVHGKWRRKIQPSDNDNAATSYSTGHDSTNTKH